MTRRKWMTPEQEDWLKTRLAEFSDAHVNKTTTKEFFPAVFKDWRKCWVTPDPSQEEITEAGNVKKATLKKKMMKRLYIKSYKSGRSITP